MDNDTQSVADRVGIHACLSSWNYLQSLFGYWHVAVCRRETGEDGKVVSLTCQLLLVLPVIVNSSNHSTHHQESYFCYYTETPAGTRPADFGF